MSSVDERLSKLREERLAREKARIEKLRQLNLKKYSKNEPQLAKKPFSTTFHQQSSKNKSVKSEIFNSSARNNSTCAVKNNFHVNGTTKRPISAPITNLKQLVPNKDLAKPKSVDNKIKPDIKVDNNVKMTKKVDAKPKIAEKVVTNKTKTVVTEKMGLNTSKTVTNEKSSSSVTTNKNTTNTTKAKFIPPKNDLKTRRKTMVPQQPPKAFSKLNTTDNLRKSMLSEKLTQSASKVNPKRQSVFERLYQPKNVPKKQIDDVQKVQTDPNYLKKLLKDSGLIVNKRHTVFEPKKTLNPPVRRSISAVHFKRISKGEMNNCIHKWSSIGEKINEAHLEVNEDENIKEDKVVSAVKSERKKVTFRTPVPFNFNTPKPDELQSRLQNWLQKRGKSIDSYHHLKCFGIHHLPQRQVLKPLNFEENKIEFEDEDKENVPLESDSDDDSYTENMNDRNEDFEATGDFLKVTEDKWRGVSFISDSVDLNETQKSMMTPDYVDDLLIGALIDLTELLREGLEWEQGARWLRAIRDRYPQAPDSAPYWECRAALEERRGDLTASVQCWEEAIAKGTEHSVVEANLDQLLDKFMQLKISPNSGQRKQPDPKMVDIKNVFKSTLIRFAVQQAKLRQSNQSETPKYTVTPVRRSGRLSAHWSGKRTPLQVCTSVRQAGLLGHPVVFVPNDKLNGTLTTP